MEALNIFRMRLLAFILLLCALCLAEPDNAEESKKGEFLGPSGGQLAVGDEDGFGLGTALNDPTALFGPSRVPVVLFGTDRESLFDIQGYYSHRIGDNQKILLEGHIDPAFMGLDLGYSIRPKHWEGTLSLNTWISTGSFAPFDAEGFQVLVPGGDEPSVQSLGAGIEYLQPFTEDLDVAFGANYYQYGFSNNLFSGIRYPIDERGSPITVSQQSGTERFASVGAHGIFSTLDDRNIPTKGTKIRFGLEQAIELGNSTTSFTRFSTNISHMFAAPGFNDGKHSLLLNLQAGTILGNPPAPRAFHLGGPSSVRGYDPGELASGRSFLQSTVEYRHFLNDFKLFDREISSRLELFYDYATTFDTTSQLIGHPPQLQRKPKNGSIRVRLSTHPAQVPAALDVRVNELVTQKLL